MSIQVVRNIIRVFDLNGLENLNQVTKMFYWFHICQSNTAWKLSKYGGFSGPCFPVFGLNTEIYSINLRIQSEYREIRTGKTPYLYTFRDAGNEGFSANLLSKSRNSLNYTNAMIKRHWSSVCRNMKNLRWY